MRNLLMIIVSLCLLSCGNGSGHRKSSIEKKIADTIVIQTTKKTAEDSLQSTLEPMNQNKLTAMCQFIKKNGFAVPQENNRYDCYQYTHYDIKGTRHAFMYIVPDNPYDPYTGAQISVWAYKDGIKRNGDLNNFVGYDISVNGVHGCCGNFIEDYPWIARGYYELNQLANKK